MKKTYNVQTLFRAAMPRSQRLRNTSGTSNSVSALGGISHTHANKTTLDALHSVDSEGYLHVQLINQADKVKAGYADIAGDSAKWGGWAFSDFFERVNVGTDDTPIYALRVKIGIFSDSFVSSKGVSAETGTGGTGVALSTVWDSLANNTDAYGSTKIHLDHIPSLTKSKISDFPTLVSAFANDAGYITASAIINKADKATTIQGYGLWEKYSDLNDAPMGAFFCGGNSVANSPESGNYISGITLAKDKNAQYRTQLGFVNNRIFTRQENGANNWSQWRELAFLGDVAKKATTLAGYGITDAVPYLETSAEIKKVAIGYGYYDAGFASTGGFISAIHHGGNYGFQLNATNTGSDIWYRGLNNGTFTEWKRIAFIDGLVANATNADNAIWLIPNSGLAYGNSGLQYFNLNGTQGTITNENVTPNAGWYHIIRQNHANNLGFFSDIATPLNSAEIKYGLYWRAVSSGTNYGWYNLLDSNNYSNYAVTLNTNQTISGVKTLSADLLSAKRGTLDIGDEYNSFNRIFAWHYKPNSLTKPILSSGKWYRIWNFSQGVAGTFQKNAIISINKAYNYEQGQTITLAVSINNWGQTYVINQLSGTTGLITKVRVTGKWNYSYVDVYISSAENAESYSVSGYGNGERVDFEELADDATKDSTRTEELTVVNGTAVNYPLSLQNATPLVVNSTTMVANLNANYLGGINRDSFQKAVYDYVNVSGTADTTALPTVIAPSNYNGAAYLSGNFKFYDTKFYNGRSNTSNRCQLAYGYDVDSIHFRRYKDGTWSSWKEVAFTDVDFLTPNSGKLSIFGAMQVNSAFRALGDVDLSSMVRTNSTTGVLDLDGNYIDVYAPMNVKTSLTIGQATISWDSVNGMLKVDTGAYFTGPVSTKGVSGGSGLVAVAQFGITWHDAWAIDANSTYVESFGTTNKSISEGQGTTNGSTITIVSDAFSGKKIGDIEIFTLGWENEAPANVRLAPYKISGNTLYCSLLLSGTMSQATFKIKIY